MEAMLLLHERGALGPDVLVEMRGLTNQIGRHLEQADDAFIAHRHATWRAPGDTEHPHRTAPHLNRHADERDHFVPQRLGGAGAVQKQGLKGNIRNHHGDPALHDLARDALPHLEPPAGLFLRGQARGLEDLQFAGFLHQADHRAAVQVAREDGHDLAHRPLQIQG